MKRLHILLAAGVLVCLTAGIRAGKAADLRLFFPLERTAYQTNEHIDVAVLRTDTQTLPAADLTLSLTGADGSQMFFLFPVKAVPAGPHGAAATEHFHLNGWLLRPGHYTLSVQGYNATATSQIDVYSHIRRSTFKTIDWGSSVQGRDMAVLGEDSVGFNLIYGEYRLKDNAANAQATLRGGADYMQCCTMGGGHQMDLRQECDWSDPYVLQGGTARAVQQAFLDRTKPNALGVHFYDEPGLTWENGTPNEVSAQLRSFRSAFGADRIADTAVKPGDSAAEEQWQFWGRWKESFLDAAWHDARFGVELVRPDFISATQSQYAWNAYADGYYFNVARSLPVISGHGGYDDGPGSYFCPVYYQEFGRMRQWNKPDWYMPSWGNTTRDDVYRLEQNLCFINDLQGLAKSPDPSMNRPFTAASAPSIVQTNKMALRFGTIFDSMPPTHGDVAVLYSLSQCLDAQIKSGMQDNYLGGGMTRGRLLSVYFAGKMIHIPFTPVVEEDILDGTLAAGYKAIILTNLNYLDPKTLGVLQDYAAMGGLVLMTDDCQVQIKGAEKVGVSAIDENAEIEKVWNAGDHAESSRLRAAGLYFRANKPLADALKSKLSQAGIMPIADCDNDEVVLSRQAQGDIEYIFAVNAAWDQNAGTPLSIEPTTATISFGSDHRPIYDALRGGEVPELSGKPDVTAGMFHFGAGQMRVFARTIRPIGGVEVQTPVVSKDFTQDAAPIHVSVSADLIDTGNHRLSGAAPCRIELIDPLGSLRYDLYRATQMGDLRLDLPLAANDPSGQWTLRVTELLDHHSGSATFTCKAATQCGALAGATRRAVFFGDDRENIFRFCRTYQNVTIVKGRSDYCATQADRLAAILKPWGVTCTIVDAAAVDKPRSLTPDEAKTWVGLEFGRAVPGDGNRPAKVGFAIDGPVILLGNPLDNPLIQAVSALGFLPYAPSLNMPGPGRGYMAWQRDAIGPRQESITLIAYDANGMAEAVGSFYEAAAGIDPMTPWNPPAGSAINPATKNLQPPHAAVRWSAILPDRVLSLALTTDGNISAISLDGSAAVLNLDGKIISHTPVSSADLVAAQKIVPPNTQHLPIPLSAFAPDRIPKFIAISHGHTAIAYWGGTLQIFSPNATLLTEQLLPQDISALLWSNDLLLVGQSDGRVLALTLP